MSSLNTKMAKGAIWMVAFRFSERFLGFISTLILARLLIPADFGLVAMAMTFVALLELIGAFNFDAALIQNQSAERGHYDTAWTYNLLFSVLITLLIILFASTIANFYEDIRLENILYVLSLSFLFQGLENIGVVAFRKELTFNKEFWFLFTKKLISFIVTVSLAFYFRNYWALVIGILTSKLAGTALSYIVHPYRPRFSLSASKDLFNFSKWLLFNNIIFFINLRAADFIIGKVLGAKALGLHTLSFEISTLPTNELAAPINRAVFPGYAKISHDMERMGVEFIKVISMIALFTLPAGLGIAATADKLIPILLGDKWLESIPLIKILAFFGALKCLETNMGAVFLAIGKPKILTFMALMHTAVIMTLLFTLINSYGLIGAAWSFLLTTIILLPVNYTILIKLLKIRLADVIKALWRIILSTVSMYFIVSSFMQAMGDIIPDAVNVGLGILLGVISYTAILMLLWALSSKPESAETFVINKVKEFSLKFST